MKSYEMIKIVIVRSQEDIVTGSNVEFQNEHDDVIQDFLT